MVNINKWKYCLIQFLIINCFKLVVNKKPYDKEQQAIWRLECALGVTSDPECPLDGGWSTWSAWSNCYGTCDEIGHRRRTRECNNPLPSKEGVPCSGPYEQIEACYIKNCTVENYRKCINGDAIRTEAMRQLEMIPALMKRCLQEECTFKNIEAALEIENTWHINPENVWNSLQCVKHNVGCPIIGEWGAWSPWSECGAFCGKGFHWRTRKCDTPPPSDDRLLCIGSPLQSEDCEGDQCAIDGGYADENSSGNWSDWDKWSPCSENCGIGVRRRRRTCFENQISHLSATWGTHCRGQHEQIEVCKNKQCLLNGGWSGWSIWGPCSQSCGAGRRVRTRSCTRPIPSGGNNCIGEKTEEGSCHHMPCEVLLHDVAIFSGESFLQYDFPKKRSTLFHSFIRFMPLSPHGSLIRRGDISGPLIRLSLQKWYLCLDVRGHSQPCGTLCICSTFVIEPAAWHSAMITVNKEGASLRINDAQAPIHGMFQCDPVFKDDMTFITIGEKFHGVVQEVIVNFIPLDMMINRNRIIRSDFIPTSASNIEYEKANLEEAFVLLENDRYLRLPCFDDQNQWALQLTLRPNREDGLILFLPGVRNDDWFCMSLLNTRLKLKLSLGDIKSEITSSTECLPDQWLDIILSKQSESGTIEALINSEERLHILLSNKSTKKIRGIYSYFSTYEKQNNLSAVNQADGININENGNTTYVICYDEFFVGSLPLEFNNLTLEEFTSFSGIIGSLRINNMLLDLHSYGVERYKDNIIQLSSRTSSISGYYHETTWGVKDSLNLTCLHARTKRTPNKAWWFYLDIAVKQNVEENTIETFDDGKVLRLFATADNYHRGFYTCRAHTKKLTRNVVTYGIIGKRQYKLVEPDATTVLAVFTTILLVISTLTWLVMEGINDLRNGYGFFRDTHLTPQEEAEAVCNYIDQNIDLYGSICAANIAKARARRKGKYLAGRSSYAAQEPQGIIQIEKNQSNAHDYPSSGPEELPTLPEVKSFMVDTVHNVYRCEPSYVGTPENRLSKQTEPSTSSSSDESSPKVLLPEDLIGKFQYSHRKRLLSKRKKIIKDDVVSYSRVKSTITEPSLCKCSVAHKILHKFYTLKHDDD